MSSPSLLSHSTRNVVVCMKARKRYVGMPRVYRWRLPFLTALFFLVILDASTISSRPVLSNEKHRIIQFSHENIYFQASSIKALFRDGTPVDFENKSIQYNSTAIGDYLLFQGASQKRQVRLYFIPPMLDWQKNETYGWKLNQVWMSDDYYGWIFWNVNGYVDSELQVSTSNVLFQCDHVEFTFWHNAPHGRFSGSEGSLSMENVEMTAFLSTDWNYSSLTRFCPCEGRGTCRAVNGKVTCRGGSYWKYETAFVSLIVALFVIVIAKRTIDAGHYSRIGQEEVTEHLDFSTDNDMKVENERRTDLCPNR